MSEARDRHGVPTALTYQILLALADEDRHGYGIIKEIEGREGGAATPSTGALYLALQRMEADRLIREAPEPAVGRGDARRRYYRLTPEGRRLAEAESVRLKSLLATAIEKGLVGGGPA